MHRCLPVALLVAALLAPAALSAVDPGARSTPAMGLDGPITAFDLATTAGRVVAGRADPSGAAGETPNAWRLWASDGRQVRSETADKDDCTTNLLFDPQCLGNVVDVAMSADGSRMVVAAQDDSDDGRLLFATYDNGVFQVLEFANEQPTSLSLSPDGTRLAVGVSRPGQTPAGQVRLYGWSGTGVGTVGTAPVWSTGVTVAPTDVALGADGRVAAAIGGTHVRFSATGTAFPFGTETVTSVAFARAGPDHWSIAGTNAGRLLNFNDAGDSPTAAYPQMNRQPGSAAIGAVAVSADAALFAAGDAAGKLRLLRNIANGPPGDWPVAEADTGGAVAALEFSTDGRYLAVAAGARTLLFRTTSTTLTELWRADAGATVVAVGITDDGGTVASAAGNTVTVFPARFSTSLTSAGNGSLSPGGTGHANLTVRNTGSRELTVALEAPTPGNGLPAGWSATLTTTTMTLLPDATATTRLDVTAPVGTAPGAFAATVMQRHAGAAQVATPIGFTIAQTHRWALQASGATSLPVQAGGSATFPFSALNLGNGADTTPVSVVIDHEGWSATLTPTTFSAAAGALASGNLTVTAPAGAKQLDAAVATIRLGADASTSLRLTATVGARFGLSLAATPASATAARGAGLDLVLHVGNTGNAPDAFALQPVGVPAGWTVQLGLATTPQLLAGSASDVTVHVIPALDAPAGAYELRFRARSLGDGSQEATAASLLTVPEAGPTSSDGPTKKAKDSPAPLAPVLVVLLLAVAALARRK